MIPKITEPRLPKHFRPIALQNCIYKLYSGLLNDRLSSWIESNGILSSDQRGFRSMEGCHLNNFILQAAIHDSRHRRRDLAIAWIDLVNAFGMISHDLLYNILRHINVGDAFVNIFANIYSGQKAKTETQSGPVTLNINRGVLQGDSSEPGHSLTWLSKSCSGPLVQATESTIGDSRFGDTRLRRRHLHFGKLGRVP